MGSLRAFVGSEAPPAGEYHDCDFEWEDYLSSLTNLPAHIRADMNESSQEEGSEKDNISEYALQEAKTRFDDTSWERFHARDNATAKFYKERRYLLLEFPELLRSDPCQHFVEIGCGCGSSILPVLKANSSCKATVSDLSPTAIQMLKEVALKAGIGTERLEGFDFDATNLHRTPHPCQGLNADALLLIFTLAALHPRNMHAMLTNAFQALRPGGLLLFRDHGLLDITHLRLDAERKVQHRLYQRGDGTVCYFFTPEDLQKRMMAVGFEICECKYACVELKNRKSGLCMRRVFLHGVFKRPEMCRN